MFKQNIKLSTLFQCGYVISHANCTVYSQFPAIITRTRAGAIADCGSGTEQTACASSVTDSEYNLSLAITLRFIYTLQLRSLLLCPLRFGCYIYLFCISLYSFPLFLVFYLFISILSSTLELVLPFFSFLSFFFRLLLYFCVSFALLYCFLTFISLPSNLFVVLCLFFFHLFVSFPFSCLSSYLSVPSPISHSRTNHLPLPSSKTK